MEVPRDAVSWLVGKGGERIQAFQVRAQPGVSSILMH